MEREASELVRLTDWEHRLVLNFRRVNEVRQDCLLCFSDELVKLQAEDLAKSKSNVVVQIRPCK